MSLTATIIAFASGIAAKVKIPRDPIKDEVERLRRRVWKLEHDLCDAENRQYYIEGLERELATERSLKLHWRDEASRLATEARERQALYQQYSALAQQAQAQLNSARQQQLGLVAQNLLGAQNLDNAHWREWVCTCIPDRASALRRP